MFGGSAPSPGSLSLYADATLQSPEERKQADSVKEALLSRGPSSEPSPSMRDPGDRPGCRKLSTNSWGQPGDQQEP